MDKFALGSKWICNVSRRWLSGPPYYKDGDVVVISYVDPYVVEIYSDQWRERKVGHEGAGIDSLINSEYGHWFVGREELEKFFSSFKENLGEIEDWL